MLTIASKPGDLFPQVWLSVFVCLSENYNTTMYVRLVVLFYVALATATRELRQAGYVYEPIASQYQQQLIQAQYNLHQYGGQSVQHLPELDPKIHVSGQQYFDHKQNDISSEQPEPSQYQFHSNIVSANDYPPQVNVANIQAIANQQTVSSTIDATNNAPTAYSHSNGPQWISTHPSLQQSISHQLYDAPAVNARQYSPPATNAFFNDAHSTKLYPKNLSATLDSLLASNVAQRNPSSMVNEASDSIVVEAPSTLTPVHPLSPPNTPQVYIISVKIYVNDLLYMALLVHFSVCARHCYE